MDTALSVILIVLSALIIYLCNGKRKRRANLPGPNGYPVVGHLFDVDFKHLHLKLFEWGKTYGDIFQINLFGKTFVVVNSSKVVRDLFLKEPNATLTSARPDSFMKNYVLSGGDVSFTSLDKQWNKRRKLMYKLMHAYAEGMQNIETAITNKLTEIRRELESNQPISDPKKLVDDFVLSVLEILLVGKNDAPDSDFHRYIISFDETGNALMNPGFDTLYTNLPFLRFFPLPPTKIYRRFLTLRDGLHDFLGKQSGKSDVGIFPTMKKMLSEKDDGENNAQWFTENIMQSMLFNILTAGYLTTRGTLLSIIRILMTVPDIQVKLQQEVDIVVGHDRQPLMKDRYDMPYHEAVILETLRFISHVPSSVLHFASEDITYGKYIIPKDSVILTNLWALHHSDDEWKNPFTFDPERFIDENGEIFPADHEIRKRFLAFGLGKRSCVGEAFAKSRVFLFLSSLMQVCTVLPPDGEQLPMLDPRDMKPGIVMSPHPFKCQYIQRSV